MNKIMLLGRLTRDPETKRSQGENSFMMAKYSLAVDRKFKKDGQPTADFLNVIGFAKTAEFIEKYLSKGKQIIVVGRLQTGSYDHKDGHKVYTTDVIAEEHYFVGSKSDIDTNPPLMKTEGSFAPINEFTDDDLPF